MIVIEYIFPRACLHSCLSIFSALCNRLNYQLPEHRRVICFCRPPLLDPIILTMDRC
ncbi:hypothetical protein BDU57DRAFT_522273 [Ampelomyces quisqualis]|uniref:Uncharacterized protein n=1 Tax=Ampelomyces quisqualis TaxID=50730 RepID=A0A6A5QCT6_AMPQU|nr:hypothetical protein BDU57DRAFT_522273 [Ampelomyces quisqualis]